MYYVHVYTYLHARTLVLVLVVYLCLYIVLRALAPCSLLPAPCSLLPAPYSRTKVGQDVLESGMKLQDVKLNIRYLGYVIRQ